MRIVYTVTAKNVAPESVPGEIELLRSMRLTFESETTNLYHLARHAKIRIPMPIPNRNSELSISSSGLELLVH